MITVESLYRAARSALPDPRSPKTGDTYRRGSGKHMVTIVVLWTDNVNGTCVYINGQRGTIERFDLWLRSMPDARPVA